MNKKMNKKYRTIDIDRLATLLAKSLGEGISLKPLSVSCAWPVFRGVTDAGEQLFVKLSCRESAEKTLSLLLAAQGCPLMPKPRLPELLDFGGRTVLCIEWKRARRVDAEDMTDLQASSFLAGCRELSGVLNAHCGDIPLNEEDSPDCQYAVIADWAAKHPFQARLIRPILSIPEAERSYRGRSLVTIHGDFQELNYGFDGDCLSTVFDFESMTRGLACEDATYAFTERARRSELSARARRRLTELFLSMARQSPWPPDEWLIALNHARLRIASRRLTKSPRSPFIALDVVRRDSPLRHLVEAFTLNSAL